MSQKPNQKIALIIGAGPAGLTAARELLLKTDIKPVVIEASSDNGGISKTINYKGNRIDIGGHRFFSKSDRVMEWWLDILPVEERNDETGQPFTISYQNKSRTLPNNPSENDSGTLNPDDIMLIRSRVSRIYYDKKFFSYPITLSLETIKNLGLIKMARIGFSYIKARLLPIRKEKSLEDFLINRFGKELYQTFFEDYTEKVWGVPCAEISAEWGAQRIKGLSITKAVLHAFKQIMNKSTGSVSQKDTETSLIEYFMYPKFGPGQIWDCVAREVLARGGEIHYQHTATAINIDNDQVQSVSTQDQAGKQIEFQADYCFSTMPIRELVQSFQPPAPQNLRNVTDGLVYRDFVTVGLLMNKLAIQNHSGIGNPDLIPDNWIYIQEPNVKLGRLQIFNNWSPHMVNDPDQVWIGLEYFCTEGDELWNKPEEEFIQFAIDELESIKIINRSDVLDHVLIKMPKAYPAYFGTYDRLPDVQPQLDQIENLFLVGRNGMHRYNNQDHSMLTAIAAVENIKNNVTSKDNIWNINTEEEYHETKS